MYRGASHKKFHFKNLKLQIKICKEKDFVEKDEVEKLDKFKRETLKLRRAKIKKMH